MTEPDSVVDNSGKEKSIKFCVSREFYHVLDILTCKCHILYLYIRFFFHVR